MVSQIFDIGKITIMPGQKKWAPISVLGLVVENLDYQMAHRFVEGSLLDGHLLGAGFST
jgi:hypothetical protein